MTTIRKRREKQAKKALHIISASVLIIAFVLPVSATAEPYYQNSTQSEYDYVNELITLAGEAVRAKDYDLANKYESEIRKHGTEIFVGTAPKEMEHLFGKGAASITPNGDVWYPPDTSAVHWYRSNNTCNYMGKAYDIVSIRAVSWDDTSAWLHVDETEVKNAERSSFLVEGGKELFKLIGSKTSKVGILITVQDVLNSMHKQVSDYYSLDIKPDDIVFRYNVDISVTFHYVRRRGEQDYWLRVKENLLEVNHDYMMTARFYEPNGKVDTRTIHNPHNMVVKTLIPDGYGDLERICQAYEADKIIEYNAGGIELDFIAPGGFQTIKIPQFPMPPYINSLSLPDEIQGE